MNLKTGIETLFLSIFSIFMLMSSLHLIACTSQSAEDSEGSSPYYETFVQQLSPYMGHCEAYEGSLCSGHVGGRNMVYIRAGESQRENRMMLRENMYSIRQTVSPECFSTVFRVICLHLFPPCQNFNNSPHPLRMCREHCQRLKTSPCARGFRMLSDMPMVKRIMATDCFSLPNVDSSTGEACAQVNIPDIVRLREEACRRQHQTGGRTFENANVIQPAKDESAICTNVVWKRFDSNVTNILNGILPTLHSSLHPGLFALSASDVYCFQMRLRFSVLVEDASKYQNLVSLPKLRKPSLTSIVPGFAVKVGGNKAKQLTFPVGFLSNYILDQNLVIPNVTLYYTTDQYGTKLFGEGAYNLCGTEFKVRIEQTGPDITFLRGSSSTPVDLSTVELAFGLKEPSSELLSLLRRFDVMNKRLNNPKLNIIWDSHGDRLMRFSGKSFFSGWGSSSVDIELILGPDRRYWLAGASTQGRNFEDIFHVLSGAQYIRLAKLMDVGINLGKLGMIFATDGASNPVQKELQFQSEPLSSMAKENPMDGFFFEAEGNIKRRCDDSDNRTMICQLLQFAVGAGTVATIKAKSTWNRFYLEVGFQPNTLINQFSSSVVNKLKKVWERMNPLTKIPKHKIEVAEDRRTDFVSRLPFTRDFWFQRIQINVQFWSFQAGFLHERPVEIKSYVFQNSKRYVYRIRNISLDDFLAILTKSRLI